MIRPEARWPKATDALAGSAAVKARNRRHGRSYGEASERRDRVEGPCMATEELFNGLLLTAPPGSRIGLRPCAGAGLAGIADTILVLVVVNMVLHAGKPLEHG